MLLIMKNTEFGFSVTPEIIERYVFPVYQLNHKSQSQNLYGASPRLLFVMAWYVFTVFEQQPAQCLHEV